MVAFLVEKTAVYFAHLSSRHSHWNRFKPFFVLVPPAVPVNSSWLLILLSTSSFYTNSVGDSQLPLGRILLLGTKTLAPPLLQLQ